MLGAGGFLGQALATALCDGGAVVRGFGRAPREHRDLDERVLWITGEFADPVALERAVEGQELVFHVLGSSLPEPPSGERAHDTYAYVRCTVELLDICRAAQVRKLVFASSGGAVYGIAASVPTPESASTDPLSGYGIDHLAIEKYLGVYRRLYDLDYQVLRIGNAYGPGQSPLRRQGFVAVTIRRALVNEPIEIWGSGTTTRDFVYVDDAVAALVEG
ncbi:MAG: NAD-dependent epimerase/dehydratase family protein, partial [Candidatus Eremiobacteraeota bacterium]|nr:NAD-dependent epimerase/dehydratase family protein [Candidatus Eremiobacteraeota bacterium]